MDLWETFGIQTIERLDDTKIKKRDLVESVHMEFAV
jgi:hypothetical protein